MTAAAALSASVACDWPAPGPVWGPYPQRPMTERPRRRSTRLGGGEGVARALTDAVAAGRRPEGLAPVERLLHRAASALARHGWVPRWQQLHAARAMLAQHLVEMPTGEGKTYALALAAGAAALAGTPVHLVTANDYLARRDAEALSPYYASLGLRVGVVTSDLDAEARRAAYACDITYCTARELGFDFLRDGLDRPVADSVLEARLARGRCAAPLLRGLCMALLDEADTLLIDEAGTPLVLARAQADAGEADFLREAWQRVQPLQEGVHFRVSADASRVSLLPPGRSTLADWPASGVPLRDHPTHREQAAVLALQARELLHRDRDYVIRADRVVLVDAHTGRAAQGRAWARGLQQLVACKEGLPQGDRHETATRVTVQQFFGRYLHLGGISGTLRESAGELRRTYGLRVTIVPPHRPRQVWLNPLRVHADTPALREWVVRRAVAVAASGRPVLLGVESVADAEALAEQLREQGAQPVVLHARQDAHEANVLASAGLPGTITVATSMAGRGCDILLPEAALQAGGLHVILCQLNGSRRIDRQFIGRAGRQGQPGSAEHHVALDFPVAARRLPVSLLKLPAHSRWSRWAVRLAQAMEAYAQSQQRVTLARWSEAQAADLAFSRAHAP